MIFNFLLLKISKLVSISASPQHPKQNSGIPSIIRLYYNYVSTSNIVKELLLAELGRTFSITATVIIKSKTLTIQLLRGPEESNSGVLLCIITPIMTTEPKTTLRLNIHLYIYIFML